MVITGLPHADGWIYKTSATPGRKPRPTQIFPSYVSTTC